MTLWVNSAISRFLRHGCFTPETGCSVRLGRQKSARNGLPIALASTTIAERGFEMDQYGQLLLRAKRDLSLRVGTRDPVNSRGLLARSALLLTFCLICTNVFAGDLHWEIERNFRYFLFNSDVALQRVAFDLFAGEHGRWPDLGELERFLNDPGFWGKPLSSAVAARNTWPKAWGSPNLKTPYDLISDWRRREGRSDPPGQADLERLGWASLLVAPYDKRTPTGSTDTCWDPVRRQHFACNAYGDYVRPSGWIVRVFDTSGPQGGRCTWRGELGAFVGQTSEAEVHSALAMVASEGAWQSPPSQDCDEIRIWVPSDASDPRRVRASVAVTRIAADGTQTTLTVTPTDTLIVGFGDSFGSGEGNPERGAIFAGPGVANTALPGRRPDYDYPFERAQWTDRWCHRSVYSWQIRAALHLSQIDRHRSVTILPYACSGAEVFEGLLFDYNGVEYSRPRKGTVTGHPAQLGLAYQELCKTYYKNDTVPAIDLAWQNDVAVLRAARKGQAIDFSEVRHDSVLDYVLKNITRCERGGSGQFPFKRDIDFLVMVAGINDIGFSRWITAALTDEQISRVRKGFIPRGGDPQTELYLQRLGFRYRILREVLDKRFLVDAGLLVSGESAGATLSTVVIPEYPRALENERGELCDRGNQGMTVATFPGGFRRARQCVGPILAVRNKKSIEAIEQFRSGQLNQGLIDLAASSVSRPGYTVISATNAKDGVFFARGFCATRDPDSAIVGSRCLAFDSFLTAPPPTCYPDATDCIPRSAESMHVARLTRTTNPDWIGIWRPFRVDGKFPPNNFYPYAHRTRLFRTPNDVYMLINQRRPNLIDETAPGILDVNGRPTGGALHPTAEAHALIGAMVVKALTTRQAE
jgi:hypothetical protein